MPDRFALVLAGGRGERFWPWSRPDRPKQLLPLARDGRTLLAATLRRVGKLIPADHCLVLTAADLVQAVARECPKGVRVIGEPVGRNTAPAIGAAASLFLHQATDPAFAVFPSDHAIDDEAAFAADLQRAFEAAERERVLLTFGISPTGPETVFGYIKAGASLGERLYRVAAFTEKPDRATAERFLQSGNYYWNSGIFVWRARVFMDALRAGRPELAKVMEPLMTVSPDRFETTLAQVLPRCEAISVDYAVLEKAPNVLMIDPRFDWDDLGSWSAWARRQPRDERGNVLRGDALVLDCEGCVVVGEGGTVAALGLKDVVVVNVDGTTLACRLDRSDEVRRVVEATRDKVKP
jgi:mannose-1-phosphate guanylyltransferase/mannose-6-phosphate isomerase